MTARPVQPARDSVPGGGAPGGRARRTRAARACAMGAWIGLGATTGGCYRYVPVPLANVRPNEDVQVRVTESAATRLTKELGAFTTQLEGPLTRQGADSVSVQVMIGRAYQGIQLEGARQTLYLGQSEVVDVRRRQLSRARTALVSAGAVAAFALVVAGVAQLGDPNPGAGEPPPAPPPGVRAARAGILIPFR